MKQIIFLSILVFLISTIEAATIYSFIVSAYDENTPVIQKIVSQTNYTCEIKEILAVGSIYAPSSSTRCTLYINDGYWYARVDVDRSYSNGCVINCVTENDYDSSFYQNFVTLPVDSGASSLITSNWFSTITCIILFISII